MTTMNSPNPPPASSGSEAMKLMEFLSDKERAAQVIADYDKAKTSAEEAQVTLNAKRKEVEESFVALVENERALATREEAVAAREREQARKRDADLSDIESQRGVITTMAKEMAERKTKFENEWASANLNQRNRAEALERREELLAQREAVVRAKEEQLAKDRAEVEVVQRALNEKLTLARKLLEE